MIKSEQLVIFDCDGVLVDSEIIGTKIETEELNKFGYVVSVEDVIRKFVGVSAKSAIDCIFVESGIKLPEDFFDNLRPTMLRAFEQELQPLMYPILSSTLLQNISKCVASNSAKERVLGSLQITGQKDFFHEQHVFTSSQVKHSKPAPDLFLFAADVMGYHPQNCIVIEDSAAGIEAAHAAGMSVIAFLGGSHAKYPWYEERIRGYNTRVANNCAELLEELSIILSTDIVSCVI
jgi:HAD superfamily hydrolase (TIGR01509 family)